MALIRANNKTIQNVTTLPSGVSFAGSPTTTDLGVSLIGKTLVNYYHQRYQTGGFDQTVSYSGNGTATAIHQISVTPTSTSSMFEIHYMYPYRCNGNRPGVKMLYMQDGVATGTFEGESTINSSSSNNVNYFYEQHRLQNDGYKHDLIIGEFLVTPNTTSTITMGVGVSVYDENTGSTVRMGGGGNDVAAHIKILEFV